MSGENLFSLGTSSEIKEPSRNHCSICGILFTKENSFLNVRTRGYGYCKNCNRQYQKEHRQNNLSLYREKGKKWQQEYRERMSLEYGNDYRKVINVLHRKNKDKFNRDLFVAYCPTNVCAICKNEIIDNKYEYHHINGIKTVMTEFGFETRIYTVNNIDDAIRNIVQKGLEPANYFGSWLLKSYLKRQLKKGVLLTNIISVVCPECNSAQNRKYVTDTEIQTT